MSKEHDNTIRPIPNKEHPDIQGRVGFLHLTYPKPGGPRLAGELERNRGYIRGLNAETLFRALKPYFDGRASQTDGKEAISSDSDAGVPVASSWISETPISGESRNFRPRGLSFKPTAKSFTAWL
jgi:hypothetical protein